jgi:hypothetical protein
MFKLRFKGNSSRFKAVSKQNTTRNAFLGKISKQGLESTFYPRLEEMELVVNEKSRTVPFLFGSVRDFVY